MELDDYEAQDRLVKKLRDNPFLGIGLVGLVGACCFGAYQFKNKGKMSTSIYLMQLRVIAQGTVVGSLTVGLAYKLLMDRVFNKSSPNKPH